MKYFFVLFVVFLLSCGQNSNQEFEKLKADLFKPTKDVSELPIYADPATGDYDSVKQGKFLFQIDSGKIFLIKKYRTELEPFVLQYLDSGDCWVYLAAFLKYESALPKLKQLLLNCDNFYGWEGGDYSTIDRYLDDEQYCYQMAYVSSIEYISGKSLYKAITLTDAERKKLSGKAKACVLSDTLDGKVCAARWLLTKFPEK